MHLTKPLDPALSEYNQSGKALTRLPGLNALMLEPLNDLPEISLSLKLSLA